MNKVEGFWALEPCTLHNIYIYIYGKNILPLVIINAKKATITRMGDHIHYMCAILTEVEKAT